MFFSTPHWGMHKSDWEVFVRCVLQQDAPSKGIWPTRSMTKFIRDNTTSLYHISEDFLPLQEDMAFISFVEEHPTKGFREVVSICPNTADRGTRLVAHS